MGGKACGLHNSQPLVTSSLDVGTVLIHFVNSCLLQCVDPIWSVITSGLLLPITHSRIHQLWVHITIAHLLPQAREDSAYTACNSYGRIPK